MGYTKRKIRGIHFSFLLASFIFAWCRTFLQGRFNPEAVLEQIRSAAHLDELKPTA